MIKTIKIFMQNYYDKCYFWFILIALLAFAFAVWAIFLDERVAKHVDSLMAFSAFLFAVGGFLFNGASRNSKYYLDECIAAVEKANARLTDKPHDRANWVSVARVLERVKKLRHSISEPEHKKIYEAEMDYWRYQLSTHLQYRATVYYGHSLVNGDINIEDAAKYSSKGADGLMSDCNWIPESVIKALYDFTRFPEDYQDPLDTVPGFGETEKKFLSKGLQDYIEHRNKFVSFGGELSERKQP